VHGSFCCILILHGKLPSSNKVMSQTSRYGPAVCMRCWVVGDKYDIAKFQDLVMLELLKYTDLGYDNATLEIDVMVEGLSIAPEMSALRELIVEHIALRLGHVGNLPYRDLDHFDGIPGILRHVTYELKQLQAAGHGPYEARLPSSAFPGEQRWRDFMTANGPDDNSHWVYQLQ
jgi:hypothetical protein